MKKILAIILMSAMIISVSGCSAAQNTSQDTSKNTAQDTSNDSQNRESIYQVALLQSLTQGYYDGIIKVSELKEHGDIGIGTFEGVNGEMIVLDGKVYQALGDGSVQEADNDETVPFSNVTFFDKDITSDISDIKNIDALKENLDKTVNENGRNMFYFIKINGTFNKMNVRSELKQKKPYKSLDKALATDQREFNYKDIKGTVVALYCPDYMDGLNTPGWHFHFVSDDRNKGGHILELAFDNAKAEMDKTSGFEMKLSDNKTFQKLELAKDVSQAIKKVETNDD
ncbi:MAG: acetolactate decarboxylase [Ruminococcus sp.]|nr:acetolactate decarboxylase [Ruminococcus sp.]